VTIKNWIKCKKYLPEGTVEVDSGVELTLGRKELHWVSFPFL